MILALRSFLDMAEKFTAVDPSGSENRVPDIWERLADGDGAAISLLIERRCQTRRSKPGF